MGFKILYNVKGTRLTYISEVEMWLTLPTSCCFRNHKCMTTLIVY